MSHHRSRPHRPGPHELGQNLLVDRHTIDRIVALVGARPRRRPVVEWAAGRGALTTRLATLGRPLEAVEVDPRSIRALRRAVPPHVAVSEGDILRHAPPRGEFDLVSNVPFHITTPVLRRALRLPDWQRAVLLVQWEVARKRAGVGGTTMLTAQWWPWFDFRLDGRVPAAAFSPRPVVDGGLLVIDRRCEPLLPGADRSAYQALVAAVFTGRGRGISDIAGRLGIPAGEVERWRRRAGVAADALPGHLGPADWVALYRLRQRVRGRPDRRRGGRGAGPRSARRG